MNYKPIDLELYNKNIRVYQIYYDEDSKKQLDSGFIPLDNSLNERPDWYEFWVIRKFLKEHQLQNDVWYGFLSPKFLRKTHISSNAIFSMLEDYGNNADVALFTNGWDQLAYFLNPFEQGEIWHPGLSRLSQLFFNKIGINIDISKLVTHSSSSVFSNYIIAKSEFWNEWLVIADQFFDFVESNQYPDFNQTTSYVLQSNQLPIKTFIQERFASVILALGDFKVIAVDQSQLAPIFTLFFNDNFDTRRLLQTCDVLKEKYCDTKDEEFLNMYYKIRQHIELRI